MVRLPLTVMAVVFAALVAISVATGEWSADDDDAAKLTPVDTIAERVETLRGHRFRELPQPKSVTGAEAKREAAADAGRPEAARARAAEGSLYAMLGLVPAGTDLRTVTEGLFDGAVAGYYDPRDGRLRIVESALTANKVLGETTIAHELTHALDDQTFELDTGELDDGGDRALAYTAMVEGSATSLQTDYQSRYISAQEQLASLGAAFGPTGTEGLPTFLTASLLFPYLGGEQWVSALREKGGWRLVDLAFDERPPVSTEQVVHPAKWLAAEAPDPVTLPGVGRAAGAGATRVTGGTFGEWQTRQLLAIGGGADSQAAAAGWGGDRYELWRAGEGECEDPCVARDTLVVRWRWDTPRDAREFVTGLRAAIPGLLDARPAGTDRWSARGGAVALVDDAAPALVLAPSPGVATAVAGALRDDRPGAR